MALPHKREAFLVAATNAKKYNRSLSNSLMIWDDHGWEWRGLHNEELHSLYHSPNIVRMIKSRRYRWARHADRKEEGRNAFKILIGTPTGKRHLGRSRRRWEDNIRMDLK